MSRGPARPPSGVPGYQNSWARKKDSELAPQITLGSPLRQDPSIAIIGGGLSGLVCARELAAAGVRSVVFDTGEHGPGGRLATRSMEDNSMHADWLKDCTATGMVFDHAAQFFTCTDPRFQVLVDEWQKAGWVRRWDGPVGSLRQGVATPAPAGSPSRWVGVGGMRQLAIQLASSLTASSGYKAAALVKMVRPMWIARMLDEGGEAWRLMGRRGSEGVYDAVVIAHNGKCANRLVGSTGAPRVASQCMALRLSAVWALTVAFDGPVPCSLEGAFIEGGSGILSWAGNNTAKLHLRHEPSRLQCWTLISSDKYGQGNKVPQEAVPPAYQVKVAADLLAAFREALGGAELPRAVFTHAQLWGAALPMTSPGVECILDPASRVGVCGDWLSGSSMQAAAISGISLGRKLAALRGVPMSEAGLAPFRLGLTTPVRPITGGTDIGQFPRAAPAAAAATSSSAAPASATAPRAAVPPAARTSAVQLDSTAAQPPLARPASAAPAGGRAAAVDNFPALGSAPAGKPAMPAGTPLVRPAARSWAQTAK